MAEDLGRQVMNEDSLNQGRLIDLSKSRASFYAFLNIHFTDLPDQQFASELRKEAFRAALHDLEGDRAVRPEIARGAALMEAYLKGAKDLDARTLAERLGVDRTRLYRGVSPGYGPAPPYEALWVQKEGDLTALLQRISRAYADGGFILKDAVHERVDYIGIQFDYLEQLVLKEISARESGEEKTVRRLLKHQNAFLLEHLGQWVPRFVASALTYARTDFYKGHLHMLNGFIEEEGERIAWLIGPEPVT
ncbi:MAG: molecular chaperone TorD family protein [Proteobacteria bacterium]|nr:molecular chaperone TorD family protein [Pseudomonadota bacterium]